MECYEHITDPLEQQKLMQIITNIMSRRPRLNLTANYFKDSYKAESACLDQQFELIRMIVDMQIKLEKTENKRLQDSLNLSYTLANTFEKQQWKYQDSESLLAAVQKTAEEKIKNQIAINEMQTRIQGDIANALKTMSNAGKTIDPTLNT